MGEVNSSLRHYPTKFQAGLIARMTEPVEIGYQGFNGLIASHRWDTT